jgi:hypothetical protein
LNMLAHRIGKTQAFRKVSLVRNFCHGECFGGAGREYRTHGLGGVGDDRPSAG